jgi:hypothetical protein
MKTQVAIETAGADSTEQITTSKDGLWKTYHQYAGLMRYVPSGTFYARFKVVGKIKRESLKTKLEPLAVARLALKRQEFCKAPVDVKNSQRRKRWRYAR